MAVIAAGVPAGRGLAEYMKWRNRRKMLKNIGEFRPSFDNPAIPMPKDVMEREGTPAIPMPKDVMEREGTPAIPMPKDVSGRNLSRSPLNPFGGQSGPPTRQGYRHHPGGYNIPANASLTPESQAVRDYQGFVSEGNPHTAYNYPMTSAGPDAIARQDYERRTNIEPFSWYKGNYGKETVNPQELNTFMGMPARGGIRKGINRADDTAQYDYRNRIYPGWMIQELIDTDVITEDMVIDLEADDEDSYTVRLS
jgi:hypothetical protein